MATSETKVPRQIPEGFSHKTVATAAGAVEYEVQVLQASSIQAILDAYRKEDPETDPEATLLAIWNAAQEQAAKQGTKAGVRKAVDEKGAGELVDSGEVGEDGEPIKVRQLPEEVSKAIAEAQDSARLFLMGAPRGGGGARHESGMTAKQRTALGNAVALELARTGKAPSQTRMLEICKELGIDPASLGS